jgi:uncharacterized protein with von Willebrand factor type A (vWA) domain
VKSHFLENLLHFPRLLRQAGLPISPEQSLDFVRALRLIEIGEREEVYHTGRSLLVTRKEHLRLYETVFNRFWRSQGSAATPQQENFSRRNRTQERRKRFDIASYMAQRAGEADREIEVADKAQTYSRQEVLRRKEFSQMTSEELEAVRRLMREMRWKVSLRQTRRLVSATKGDVLHIRRVLRSATKYGGIPLRLSWQTRKIKQRPLILIADISGSMEKYARIVLQFFFSVSHSLKDVECFLFGTRLTHVTPHLKLKNIDRAIDQAAREVVDWSGGTRIGESLRSFNRHWSRRVLRRGAIVIVISDGWERGDAKTLGDEMRFLQQRCHRLIWLNPLLGRKAYEPRVEGMAAALPFIDDFLPIHNLQSLHELSEHLSTLERRRSARTVRSSGIPAAV